MTSAASERERGRGPVGTATVATEAIVARRRAARVSPAAQATSEQPVPLLRGRPQWPLPFASLHVMPPSNTAAPPDGGGASLWQHRLWRGRTVPAAHHGASPRVTGNRSAVQAASVMTQQRQLELEDALNQNSWRIVSRDTHLGWCAAEPWAIDSKRPPHRFQLFLAILVDPMHEGARQKGEGVGAIGSATPNATYP